jgi:elongation factor 1-gamma
LPVVASCYQLGTDNPIPFKGDQCRTIAIKAVAKANGLDLDIREMPRTPDHLSISKLGKVPAFQGADGFKLFECMAIALYS